MREKRSVCSSCGTEATKPRRTWQQVSSFPDRMGRMTVTTMGAYKCLNCGKAFRRAIGKVKMEFGVDRNVGSYKESMRMFLNRARELKDALDDCLGCDNYAVDEDTGHFCSLRCRGLYYHSEEGLEVRRPCADFGRRSHTHEGREPPAHRAQQEAEIYLAPRPRPGSSIQQGGG